MLNPDPGRWQVSWVDKHGQQYWAEYSTERDAVAHVAAHDSGGLRFHDLRHSYATWLVTAGTPINDVQAAMGHEQPSTTLNRNTHRPKDYDRRILAAFSNPDAESESHESDSHDQTDKGEDIA